MGNPSAAQHDPGARVILQLVGVLHDIEADARGARHQFQLHPAVNGRTALRRIEERCQDALAAMSEREDAMGPPSGEARFARRG